MTKPFSVSAPGSTMICGEHAVVYGYPAIVCAVEQRISVTLSPREDDDIIIHSELAHYRAPRQQLSDHPKLRFVLEAIKRASLTHGINLSIQSAIDPTLGLGSSAAVTVATLGALNHLRQGNINRDHIHQQALSIVRDIQQRGSGADLAASVYGGILAYQTQPTQITPLDFRLPLNFSLRYSGYKTPTADVLALLANKMAQDPQRYEDIYQNIGNASQDAIQAIDNNDGPLFTAALNYCQNQMDELGVSDATLAQMIDQAMNDDNTLASKISGSGLGDSIISVSFKPFHPSKHTPIVIASQGVNLER